METVTKHVADAIKHAAEMLCNTTLEATQSLNKEIARFSELLLELDVINDARDADTFDSIRDYLVNELGVVNTETILKVAYKGAYPSEPLIIPEVSLTKAEAEEVLELIRKHLSLWRANMLTPSFIRNLITDAVIDVLLH